MGHIYIDRDLVEVFRCKCWFQFLILLYARMMATVPPRQRSKVIAKLPENEIEKILPCVLVAASPVNQARRTVLVVPLSSSGNPPHPPIAEGFLHGTDVLAVCEQSRAVGQTRLSDWIVND